MPSNYPTSLDDFTNPTVSDYLNSTTVPHATQHSDLNDAVENLQAKVGIDSSADTDSLDYKVTDHETRISTVEAGATATAVIAYADLAARTAANPSPSEGDVSWQEDTNRFDIYNGSAWAAVAGGAYTDYSASLTLTNWTLGNAVVEAWYTQVNELVHFFGVIEFGSTSAYSGTLVVDLPIACEDYYIYGPNGTAIAEDGGTTRYMCFATSAGGTSLAFRLFNHSAGTYSTLGTVNNSTPFSWTTGDKIAWNFVYKAA